MGDAAPVVCPPGYVANAQGLCAPPDPTLFQRIGAGLTSFFGTTGAPPVAPYNSNAQTSFTQSPLFLPVPIGGGVLVFMLMEKKH